MSSWTIEDYAHCNTAALREAVFHYAPVKKQRITTAGVALAGAYTAITLGTLGMLYCLPFLFSSSMEDLVGAGFPFVGGAMMAGAGLVALSNLANGSRKMQVSAEAHIQ